jgi:hypothetical protein
VSPPERHGLRRAALSEGAWLHIVDDRPQRAALWTLVLRAERLRSARADFGAPLDALVAVAAEESLMALLTSHVPGSTAEVQVGQALQRVLLTATAAGLATSVLRQVVETPQTREELRCLIGGTRPPQAVLRIGPGRPAA